MTRTMILLGLTGLVAAASAALALTTGGPSQPTQTAASAELAAQPSCDVAQPGATCLPVGAPERLDDYRLCSAVAATRMLGPDEAEPCLEAFLAVKLSFIAGMDVESYRALPVEDQIALNLTAYSAYRAWRMANPDAVTPCIDPASCAS